MKRRLCLIWTFGSSNLIGALVGTVFMGAWMGGWVAPAIAQDQGLQHLHNSVAFPRSSERFFDAGQQQLEPEIRHLQAADAPTFDILKIDPMILQQSETWQPEQPFWDGVRLLQNSPLPNEPLENVVH